MAGRKSSREGGEGPERDDVRRRQERAERARRRAERAAAEDQQDAARDARRAASAGAERSWASDEWLEPDHASTRAEAPGVESFAAPATRAGQDRQRAFAPLAPAPAPRGRARAVARPAADEFVASAGEGAAASTGEAVPVAREPNGREDGGRRIARRGVLPARRPAVDLRGVLASALAFASTRRRAIGAGAGVLVIVVIVAKVLGGGGDSPADRAKTVAQQEAAAKKAAKARWAKSRYGVPTAVKLPPKTRIVAYAGAPRAKALGILGTVPFATAAAELKKQSAPYARPTRHVLRAYDLIATVASATPGPAGKYRTRQPPSVIARYLRAARRDHATLILDIQPGQSNFVDELKPLERWLRQPDVQLALDPEWRMRPGVVPGTQIGYVNAGELGATLQRVAAIVKAGHLPDKMVLVHRFTDGMIRDFDTVKVPQGIVGVISIDGVGAKANKVATYNRIAPTLPKPWLPGFKLFYQEDAQAGGVMSGKEVMGLKPRPHVVLYE